MFIVEINMLCLCFIHVCILNSKQKGQRPYDIEPVEGMHILLDTRTSLKYVSSACFSYPT